LVGQATAYSALSDFSRALPPSPESATLANQESAGKYYAETCYYRGSAGNETQSQGIKPRRYGLVVLAYANKNGVPRVLSWPGNHLFSSIQFSPCTPPLTRIGKSANRESAGKYYAETCYYRGSAGNKTQSQGIEPGTALLLAFANTTKP
jgi:hypothetical protein